MYFLTRGTVIFIKPQQIFLSPHRIFHKRIKHRSRQKEKKITKLETNTKAMKPKKMQEKKLNIFC